MKGRSQGEIPLIKGSGTFKPGARVLSQDVTLNAGLEFRIDLVRGINVCIGIVTQCLCVEQLMVGNFYSES